MSNRDNFKDLGIIKGDGSELTPDEKLDLCKSYLEIHCRNNNLGVQYQKLGGIFRISFFDLFK